MFNGKIDYFYGHFHYKWWFLLSHYGISQGDQVENYRDKLPDFQTLREI